MRKLASLLALLFVLGLAIGCLQEAESPLYKEPEVPTVTEGVTAIDVSYFTPASWDDDPEVDGIDFVLQPIDEAGKVVKTTGMLTAKLWLEEEGGAKGEFIQEWVDLPVTESDYAFPMGYTIRLEFTDFEPEAEQQYGIFEVTFVIPDGSSFTDNYRMILGR